MPTFRIHFAGGQKLDVQASTVDAARKLPAVKDGGAISKIKRVKGGGHG